VRATLKFYFVLSACTAVVASAALIAHAASTSTDKYMVKVPGGLAFSEFQGYESWQTVSISYRDNVNAVILANPIMIKAFEAGIPQNGKPFPDGAKMAKIHWTPTKNEYFQDTTVSGAQQNADFMEKDSKRFADTGGWGYAAFEYEVTSNTFRPASIEDKPAQGHDAKCGFACHTVAKSKDYVFSRYAMR
jgi:hypothetical protein